DDVLGEGAVDVDPHPPHLGPQVRPRRAGRVVDVPDRDLVAEGRLLDAGPECVDDAGRLMARHARQLVGAETALLEEQVRTANAARLDTDARLARARLGNRPLDEPERLADASQ